MTEKNDFTIENPIMYDKENGRCRCIPIPYEKYMTEKRFVKGHCCGDVGLIDTKKEEWFVENINSISDSERNWNDVLDKLNEVAEENEELKQKIKSINEILNEDIGYIESLRKIEEALK